MTKAAIDTLTHIGNYRDEKVPVTFCEIGMNIFRFQYQNDILIVFLDIFFQASSVAGVCKNRFINILKQLLSIFFFKRELIF